MGKTEIAELFGITVRTLESWLKSAWADSFPKPITPTPHALLWRRHEVEAFVNGDDGEVRLSEVAGETAVA